MKRPAGWEKFTGGENHDYQSEARHSPGYGGPGAGGLWGYPLLEAPKARPLVQASTCGKLCAGLFRLDRSPPGYFKLNTCPEARARILEFWRAFNRGLSYFVCLA